MTGFAQVHRETKDLKYFLHRLYTTDHLPILEDSHTFMASTWDTTGGNSDGDCFKDLRGATNMLLDVDGPGCVHRIFTGITYGFIDWSAVGVDIQVFIDGNPQPLYNGTATPKRAWMSLSVTSSAMRTIRIRNSSARCSSGSRIRKRIRASRCRSVRDSWCAS